MLQRGIVWAGLCASLMAQNTQQQDLEKISQELQNPLTKTWSLVFQNNLGLQEGEAITGRPVSNTFFFQPALPIPVGRRVLIMRPVFPILTTPRLDAGSPTGVSGRVSGYGDTQLLALVGTTTPTGFVYAFGGTFKFPTASSPLIGQGKYQAGPSIVLAKIGKLNYGVSAQHWWSYAGDASRPAASQTDIGYFVTKPFKKVWSVGTGPTISVNWRAPAGQELTFPVGLVLSKVTRFGSLPTRISVQVFYSAIRPDAYATGWNFRFQVVPVIKSPLAL